MEKQTNNTESKLNILRHSTSHILAMAVLDMFPEAKLGIGPTIEDGFYYDFDLPRTLIPEDLPILEEKMRAIIKQNVGFEKTDIDAKKAEALFKKAKQVYKVELIKDLVAELNAPSPRWSESEAGQPPLKIRGGGKAKRPKQITVSIYKTGSFVDLCRGPHIDSTGEIKPDAFKLLKIAGAYWRGSEKNKMLQRIYGTAWESKKDLDEYLKRLEEAEKRDHRKLGKDLELFDFSEEIGAGLPLWLPKGTIIREELEKWAKETEANQGYQRVVTPHITKSKLFYISGHLPHYAQDMYAPFKIDEEEYYLKPMNCPFHHMIYKSKQRSYKELPLRLAEYGTVYRYERSGTLNGLMRVRGLCQNDSHNYCTLNEAKDEFLQVMQLHKFYYDKLGIKDYYMELALRDPNDKEKYHGDDKMWTLAEKLTRQAMNESKIPYVEKIGEAAFYGPKIDFIIKTVIGREFAISTNQLDLYMAGRFGLEYIDEKGKKQTPAIIHRAPLGSHERFVAFLIEHFAGAFPVWLAPEQAWVLPIGSRHEEYAKKVAADLKAAGVRVVVKNENETIGKKIREGEMQKIPYLLVVGDKEIAADSVAVRERGKGDLGPVKLNDFTDKIVKEIMDKTI